MYCPRLDHFVRFNPNGTVSRCGHMVNAPQYTSLAAMEASSWLVNTKELFKFGTWPAECIRCQEVEADGPSSIRIHALALDESESNPDYLQVGGVLDNVCNAACQTCGPDCSTRIGALVRSPWPRLQRRAWRALPGKPAVPCCLMPSKPWPMPSNWGSFCGPASP